MAPNRFEPSSIKNKIKREDVYRASKKTQRQAKLKRRLAQAEAESKDPMVKKKRVAENVPKTLDNMREFDPSILTANPNPQPVASTSTEATTHAPDQEAAHDIENDPFASYFTSQTDPTVAPRVLITTSPKSCKTTYNFCDELVGVIPGGEFIQRKKGKGFEIGRIAGWAGGRGYSAMVVVNEDMKRPNAITLIHLPSGPTAYFKLTSVELSTKISGHARATPHNPELVLNGFVTRLGHAVGRMFQTLFPPMPEFEGRQVVTLHNQRDFLFFRRHRYAFRSPEKAALQEIGPRFTLKLRSFRKGIPAVTNFGAAPPPLITADAFEESQQGENSEGTVAKQIVTSKEDDFEWLWKPELEVTRRTFFL